MVIPKTTMFNKKQHELDKYKFHATYSYHIFCDGEYYIIVFAKGNHSAKTQKILHF